MANITAGQLIVGAFNLARSQYPELNKRWINASYRMGGIIRDAALTFVLQQAGELDLLCRSIEQETQRSIKSQQSTSGSEGTDLQINYLELLSSQWVSVTYAAHFALHSRKLLPTVADNFFDQIRILRVQLEKHEIADPKDRKQRRQVPIEMTRMPEKDGDRPFLYDPRSATRSHITPRGLSQRGSYAWLLIKIDKNKQENIWVERQDLANQMLSIWSPPLPQQRI